MSDTKFTPGPWVVDFDGTIGHVKSVAENEYANTPTVARYDIGIPGVSESEQYANAHLIAAAPELYKVLDEMTAFMHEPGCYSNQHPMVQAGMQALAKARGEKS